MKRDDAEDLEELLSYPEHSAGGIMTPDYACSRSLTIALAAVSSRRS